ncbi:MAG: hypothetical protein HQP61_09140 [Peptococcaceae bacterium]|nr:hypothetical protein [Candidatus Syntrophopropionicum ammoniitolerans]
MLLLWDVGYSFGVGRLKAESRKQKAESRRQKAEGRRQKAEGGKVDVAAGWAVVSRESDKKTPGQGNGDTPLFRAGL